MSLNSKSCRSDAEVRSGIAARLAEIQARADKATDAPWFLDSDGSGHAFVGNRADGREHGLWEIVHVTSDKLGDLTPECAGQEIADAEFIAHARTDVPALANGLESVLDYVGRCEESGITMQPGDVRRLIAAALGGAS